MATRSQNLKIGRTAVDDRAWQSAFSLLGAADLADPLGSEDLRLMATAAFMLGRDDDMVACLERSHQLYLQAGALLPAVHDAIWIGLNLALRGEMGPASGWFGRAARTLEDVDEDNAERGYLVFSGVLGAIGMGDFDAAAAAAKQAIVIGRRFEERDLVALAVHGHGRALMRQGHTLEGLNLLDEAMVAVIADRLSPIVTGIIYCSVIEACHEVLDFGRARQWTEALSQWCRVQPEMVAFTGQCLTHRAEVMQMRGDWQDALAEADRASGRFIEGMNQAPVAQAYYRQGELYRLTGDLQRAEAAYRQASRWGWSPQPGYALLRAAQGDAAAGRAALSRVLGESEEWVDRARVLPAFVEILLSLDEVDAAGEASQELDELAEAHPSVMLSAVAHYERGSLLARTGDAVQAVAAFRTALRGWQELEAPYEAAKTRAMIGIACHNIGDHDSARLEFDAARSEFRRLGAAPDLDWLARQVDGDRRSADFGLTGRELEVLGLVASGATNKAIASELFVSERTVDRHVSNIFSKLAVTTRTAAATYAHEHGLL